MSHSSRPRAIVIGGSLGGLFAANMLHRARWEVDVYERAREELSGRGAGIVTHPELFDCLRAAGVTIDDTIGVQVLHRVAVDQAGNIVLERRLPQIVTAWGRLYHLLKSAFPAERQKFGKALQDIEQNSQHVTAVFADGERVQGDLLVGADGFRSSVRGLFCPEVKPIYAGYIAWRGLVDEEELSPETRAAIFERFAFFLPPGEQILGYPVAGRGNRVAPGARRFNFVWYRPANEEGELPRLLTDVDGRRHEDGIPPHLISRDKVEGLLAAADRVLAPQFVEVVRKTPRPFLQPIIDLETPELVFGRVVLLGDAAYVARPHCAMGVTKAGSDARVLTRVLVEAGGPSDAALQAYQRERSAFGHFIVEHGRHLAKHCRTPEAVVSEVGVPPTPPE